MRKALAAATCVAVLFLASCASLQRSADTGVVRQFADLINAGSAQKLTDMSVTPFLVDGEIVVLPADVSSFWADIVKAGFRVEGAALDTGTVIGPESYQQYASTMEVKTFFSRYVPRGARIIDLSTSTGAHVRLLVRSGLFSTKIYGFKGPF